MSWGGLMVFLAAFFIRTLDKGGVLRMRGYGGVQMDVRYLCLEGNFLKERGLRRA